MFEMIFWTGLLPHVASEANISGRHLTGLVAGGHLSVKISK